MFRARAGWRYEYCQSSIDYTTETFSIDHAHPTSQGGGDDLENLVLACQGCNSSKHAKTQALDPENLKFAMLFNSRVHDWNLHFAWIEGCSLIAGLTPTGRATVEALKLNRSSVVNLRKLLFAVGKHPPEIT